MPTIAVTIVDQTVAVTQVGEIGPTGATGATGTVSAAGDGSAGAPGIAFASDTNTGIFRPGADIVAVSTGGLERARFSSAGIDVTGGENSPHARFSGVTGRGLTIGTEVTAGTTDAASYLNALGAGSGALILKTENTEHVRVLPGGNVGIGTNAPSAKLEVYKAADAGPTASYDGFLSLHGDTDVQLTAGVYSSSPLGVWVQGMSVSGGPYPLTLNPIGGNVGIGTTSPQGPLHALKAAATAGVGIFSASTKAVRLGATADFSTVEGVDSTGFASFQPLRVGGSTLEITTSGTVRVAVAAAGHVTPGADNTQNFGSGSFRWNTIYAGTGTINTSDERYKVLREGGDLSDAEFAAWSNVRAIVYQDKDSYDRKGDDARLHVGYSWQAIAAAFAAQGLDANRYGLWCEDPMMAPVTKTRTAKRPTGESETVPVLGESGEPVFEQVQATETIEQPFEEVRIVDGAPVLVKGTRMVEQPLFDSVQVKDEAGELVFTMPEPVEDAEPGEPVPLMAPVPRMISKAKTETVPVMEDFEEEFTEMEPTGETRGALRYQECAVLEAAWLRRQLALVEARVAALEAS